MVVDAPLQMRVKRAALRDGAPEYVIMNRVANQRLLNEISAGNIPDTVDVIIKNDADIETLAERLRAYVDMTKK